MNNMKLCILLLAMLVMLKLNNAQDMCKSQKDDGGKTPKAEETNPIKKVVNDALYYKMQAEKAAAELEKLQKKCCEKCKDLFALKDGLKAFQIEAYANYKIPVENVKDQRVIRLLNRAEIEKENFLESMKLIRDARELLNDTVMCADEKDAGIPNDDQVKSLKDDASKALKYREYAKDKVEEIERILPGCCTNCTDFFALKKALENFQEKALKIFIKPVELSTYPDVIALVARARAEENFLKRMQLIEEARVKQDEINNANEGQKNDLNEKIRTSINDLKEIERKYEPLSAEYRVIRKLMNDLMIALASEMIMDKEAALDSYDRFIRELNFVATPTTPAAQTTTIEDDEDFFEWLIDTLFSDW